MQKIIQSLALNCSMDLTFARCDRANLQIRCTDIWTCSAQIDCVSTLFSTISKSCKNTNGGLLLLDVSQLRQNSFDLRNTITKINPLFNLHRCKARGLWRHRAVPASSYGSMRAWSGWCQTYVQTCWNRFLRMHGLANVINHLRIYIGLREKVSNAFRRFHHGISV